MFADGYQEKNKEFIMKDAYSFHTSQEDLEDYYAKCFEAYTRIFRRVGIPEVKAVKADSGIMGGSISHEFMLLVPAGEDSIAVCSSCGYSTNLEAAECSVDIIRDEESEEPTYVKTPDIHTIDELCGYLNITSDRTCKAVVYRKGSDSSFVIVFIRGDLEISETKVINFIADDLYPADLFADAVLKAGFIGPVGLPCGLTVLFDRSLQGANNIVCGANKEEYHLKGFDMERDCPDAVYNDFSKLSGSCRCPQCGNHTVGVFRGIEVGNIFQLGTKYTKPMKMQYTDTNGNLCVPFMGCYGIGIGRLAASVCEGRHDDYGPIWPVSIAPWEVHICCLKSDDPVVKNTADSLYLFLEKNNIETIYDDRQVSAGIMFSDADLIGAPVRVTVSMKNIKNGCVEVTARDKTFSLKPAVGDAPEVIISLLEEMKASYR